MRILLLLSFLLVATPQQAQKYTVDPDDLRQPLALKELSEPGLHSVSVSRRFSNEREGELLNIAEAVYSPREVVLKCMRPPRPGEKEPTEPRLWSCGEADGTDLPYAITKSAVAYFIKHSEALRRGEIQSRYLLKTGFSYDAGISRQDSYRVGDATFRDVYVVTMRLYWHQTCGEVPDMCSMILEKSRKVILDKNGSVLATEGDGAPIPLFS
jgi:hypothetical protein